MRKIDPVLPPPPPNFPYLFFLWTLPFPSWSYQWRGETAAPPGRPSPTRISPAWTSRHSQDSLSTFFNFLGFPLFHFLPFISEVEEVVAVVVIVRIASDLVWFLVRLWHTLKTDCICYEFDWNYFLISSCGPYWLHSWVVIKQKTNNNRTSKVF